MGIEQTFGPILEGSGGAYVPEVAYVQQGTKAFFFVGESTLLHESIGDVQIVESADDLEWIEEDGEKKVKDGKWIVEGPFQRSDTKNANGRTYPRSIWERILNPKSDTQKSVKAGGMVGHLEHPTDGHTNGNLGALKILSLKLREDGVVWGRAKVLGTVPGNTIREYIREGVRWGVSSRGNGSVGSDGKVNEKDFRLVSFDAVMNPSTPGAYPKPTLAASANEGIVPPNGVAEGENARKGAQQSVLQEAMAASSLNMTGLSETAHYSAMRTLISHLTKINEHVRDTLIPASDAARVSIHLLESLDAVEGGLERCAESRARVIAEHDDPDDASAVVIAEITEEFERRITDVLEESGQLQESLDAERGEVILIRGELADALAEAQQHRESSEIAATTISELQRRLAIAEQQVTEATATGVGADVEDAVMKAIKKHPVLSEYVTVLEGANDANAVQAIVECLVDLIRHRPTGRTIEEGVLPSGRSTLPSGDVKSDTLPTKTGAAPINEGAKMAGKALKRMSPK